MAAGHHLYIDILPFEDPEIRPYPRVELDLPENFGYEISMIVEELNDVNQVRQPAILPITLPGTALNLRYLSRFVSINAFSVDYQSVPASAWVWGKKLHQNRLFVLSIERGEEGTEINCELAVGEEHYIEQSKGKALNTIDLGNYLFTGPNVELNWTDDVVYDTVPVYHGFVDHGRFPYSEGVGVDYEYFRPLYSPLALLRQGFCELGYKFECPYLETDEGRRWWSYLLDENFNERVTDNGRAYYAAEFEYDPFTIDWTAVDFGSQMSNFTNDPINESFIFDTPADRELTLEFCFTGLVQNLGGVAGTYNWQVIFQDSPTTYVMLYESEDVNLAAGGSHFDQFISPPIQLPAGETILIQFVNTAVAITPGVDYNILTKRRDKWIYRGTDYSVTEPIDPEYSLFDLLAGITHALSGKLDFNYQDSTVTLYTPEETDVQSTAIDGYLQREEAGRLIEQEIGGPDSVVRYPGLRQNRFILLSWKGSQDNYIGLQGFDENEPPHSRLVDMGNAIDPDGIDGFENPFFEPTIERQTYEMNSLEQGPSIPAMWDNDEGEDSCRIGPRLLYGVGMVRQFNERGDQYAKWNLKTVEREAFPYVSQVPQKQYNEPLETSPFGIAYGTYDDDLFTRAWRYGIAEDRESIVLAIDVKTTLSDLYDPKLFRKTYQVQYNGESLAMRLNSVEGHNTNGTEFTRLIFIQLQSVC